MSSILFLTVSILLVTGCTANKRIKIELAKTDEPQPMNQSSSSETDENSSNPLETHEEIDSQSITLIIGDYLDRSISLKNSVALDLIYITALSTMQGDELFNFLNEIYANQENSPVYQYATNQFPNNRIVQSSIASATVADAELLMANAMEEIDEGVGIDQIIVNLGALDFCQATADFSLRYQEMLTSLLENESLESTVFTIISPIDLTKLPYFDPLPYEGKDILVQHQFCPALSDPRAEENFKKILLAINTEAFRLSDSRTVFFANISDVSMIFDQEDMDDGFNLKKSGIAKITNALEENMIAPNLDFLNSLSKN